MLSYGPCSGLGIKGLAKIAKGLPDVAKTMKRVQRAHPNAQLTALPDCGQFLLFIPRPM